MSSYTSCWLSLYTWNTKYYINSPRRTMSPIHNLNNSSKYYCNLNTNINFIPLYVKTKLYGFRQTLLKPVECCIKINWSKMDLWDYIVIMTSHDVNAFYKYINIIPIFFFFKAWNIIFFDSTSWSHGNLNTSYINSILRTNIPPILRYALKLLLMLTLEYLFKNTQKTK